VPSFSSGTTTGSLNERPLADLMDMWTCRGKEKQMGRGQKASMPLGTIGLGLLVIVPYLWLPWSDPPD
jgi:hypothetical protein